MTRGSYCQVVCNQLLNDRQYCLFWMPVFSTRIRLQIVVSSLDFKTRNILNMLFVDKPFIWNIIRLKCTLAEVRNKRKLSSCICIDSSQIIAIVIFHLGCLSVYVIYFWILCSMLSSIFMLEVCTL